MRKITEDIAYAFENGTPLKRTNTETDGNKIWLHGNTIAQKIDGTIFVTLAGWNTNTTRERLNGLRNVHVRTKLGQPYLNDKEWSGAWARMNDDGTWEYMMQCNE